MQDTEKDKKYLLVLKQALPSSLSPFIKIKQPAWQNEAERITLVQHRMQHVSPGGMGVFPCNDDSFVSRWTQPVADKISFDYFIKEKNEHLSLMYTLGQLAAAAQLRSSGRDGSAIADELIAFGNNNNWQNELLKIVFEMATQTKKDYKEYCTDYDNDFFK